MTKLPKMIFTSLLAASSLVASHYALAEESKDDAAIVEFAKMDVNKDGKVSAMEYGALARRTFNGMDTNKDRAVTAEELIAAQLPHPNITGLKPAKPDLSGPAKIKLVDSNKDGYLSAQEHVASAQVLFNKMDKNKDGFLTLDEVAASHASLSKGKKAPGKVPA